MHYAFYSLGFGDEPLSRKEAMDRNDWDKWHEAEKVEVEALRKAGTFKYVPISEVPKGKKIIRCKWVYKRKPDRYKARLVVGGNGRFINKTCLLNTSTLPKEASSQDHKIPMALLAHTV